MKKISSTQLLTDSFEDLYLLKPSPKNRSSFANREDGVKAKNNKYAAIKGEHRVSRWAKFLEENPFSNFADLPVWDNGDGTYTLGDGHTRIEALKCLYKNDKLAVMPNITLTIKNVLMSYEEFINETVKFNTFSGFKWDALDKVDALYDEGNANAKQILDGYTEYRDYFNGKEIAFSLILGYYIDRQGGCKSGEVESELTKLSSLNPYVDEFFNFIKVLDTNIKECTAHDEYVDIFSQHMNQTLYNFFMCAAFLNKKNGTNEYTTLLLNFFIQLFTKKGYIKQNSRAEFVSKNYTPASLASSFSGLVSALASKEKNTKIKELDKTIRLVLSHNKVGIVNGMKCIEERGGRFCLNI